MLENSKLDIQKSEKKSIFYKQLPYNIEAEQVVLGSILINNELVYKIIEIIKPDYFYENIHIRIYEHILKFLDKGIIASPVTLKSYFEQDEALLELGGVEYLARLASSAAGIFNLESYAEILKELAMRRKLIEIGSDIVNESYDVSGNDSYLSQIEKAEHRFYNLASEGGIDKSFIQLKDSITEAIKIADIAHKRKSKISGIETYFNDLDHLLGGLQNSDLVIIAGRPSMGKTAFALNLALNSCKSLQENNSDKISRSVAFFSLEMSSCQLANRIIAMEAEIDTSRMRTGSLNDDEFYRVVNSSRKVKDLPFFIDDTPAISVSTLRSKVRRLKRKHNISLVIVDYLQLLKGSSKGSRESRVQEISEITQFLKAIAKEFNVPVVALSQLSRAVETREDKRPQLSDLRESGSIEQDADVVMFLFREEYYIRRKQPSSNESEKYKQWQKEVENCMNRTDIIVAKQRNGPIGNIRLHFNYNTTKFENFTDKYNDYPT